MNQFLKVFGGNAAKNILKYLSPVCLTICLVSCDSLFPPPPSGPTAPYHPGSSPLPGQGHPSTPTQPFGVGGGRGVVKCNQQYTPDHFNQQIKGFLSALRDPSGLGFVGCLREHEETHKVYFHVKGSVFFENGGKLSLSNLSQTLKVSPAQSKIEFFIKPQNGREIHISLPASAIAGEVRGNVALLTFEDNKGRVILDGEIRSNAKGLIVFSAPFRYENDTYVGRTDVTGYKGVIGIMEIPACQFFDCAG